MEQPLPVSPWERLAATFAEHDLCFERFFQAYCEVGYVHVSPSVCAFGRPVESTAPVDWIRDPYHAFTAPDAWWIHGFSGDPAILFHLLPFELPLFGFERFDLIPRFFSVERARRILMKGVS
jgi:hypothetical protein